MQPNIVTRWWIEATEKDETNKQKNNTTTANEPTEDIHVVRLCIYSRRH